VSRARALENYLETASRLVSRAAVRRLDDVEFGELLNAVDTAIITSAGGSSCEIKTTVPGTFSLSSDLPLDIGCSGD